MRQVDPDTLLDEIRGFVETILELNAQLAAARDLRLHVGADLPAVAMPLQAAKRRVIPRRGTFAAGDLGEARYRQHGNGIDFELDAEYRFNLQPWPPRAGVTHVTFGVLKLHRFLASRGSPPPSREAVGEAVLSLLEDGKLSKTDWPFGGRYGGQFFIAGSTPTPDGASHDPDTALHGTNEPSSRQP